MGVLAAASFLVLALSAGLAAAQSPCDAGTRDSAFPLAADPESCEKFIFCGAIAHKMKCGAGTLFNSKKGACVLANDFDCPAWGSCGSNRMENFQADCCGGYFKCENGEVTMKICPNNQRFDNVAKRCATSGQTCSSNEERCVWREDPTNTGGQLSCASMNFMVDVNNPCGYIRRVGDQDVYKDCPLGTRFFMDTVNDRCGCDAALSADDPCAYSANPPTTPSCTDVNGQFRLSVNNFQASGSYQGQNMALDMLSGVNVLSNSLRFGGGGENVVLIPYLANNGRMFIKDFGIQITFSVDTQSNAEMDILSNEDGTNANNGRDCNPSVYLKVRVAGNQRIVTFQVRDGSGTLQTITGTINTNQPWMRVTVGATLEGTLSGKVEASSSASMNNPQTQRMSSVTIATPIQTVKCNLGLGRRYSRTATSNLFKGDISQMTIYMGCQGVAPLLQ